MPTLVLDPAPAEMEALLERRHRFGADTHDEMWQGVLHMAPAPLRRHARLQAQLTELLGPLARARGLEVVADFNLGASDDYRVPDGGLLAPGPDELYVPTAALVVEVVSPGDETWAKRPFYAAHHVDELLIVDPQERAVHWLSLSDGEYREAAHSALIGLGHAELAEQIDWP
jgi:Uma2 family endonuclease